MARGKDCRSNLYLLPTGEIVYFVAAVVVLFNVEEQCQRHYTGHTDDVKCLAIHPNKLIVASGQCAGHDRLDARPHIRVWNSVSLATLAVLGAGHIERAVQCLSFSRADGGALLAAVDDGPDHTISVWDWQRADKGHCDVLSGDSSGNIAVWARGTNTVAKLVRGVHSGAVFSLCALKEGGVLSAGGKDGRLVLFGPDLSPTGQEAAIEGHYGGVRVVAEGRGDQLYVGTTRNCILHGDMQLGFSPAVLDVCSRTSRNREKKKTTSISKITNEPIQTIQYSPDNSMVALGSRDNFIYVYRVEDNGARYSRLGKCLGHSSYITHLDWSADSQYIRSNSGDYELLYWNATTCRQIPQPTSMRDVTWATNTCPITFQTIGVWPENADGTDINTCTR
ncbi:hypothetical protein HF086_003688 [Spodoptera exigua]|uniref:Uncharacterized protein n=1 Tax=Spodoptera exigua TaxID=7107 RepID=A0A922M2G6_SPOEX|nr:hypothetical protein HF086_003688 [Spodoptera exigua]